MFFQNSKQAYFDMTFEMLNRVTDKYPLNFYFLILAQKYDWLTIAQKIDMI